MFLELCWYLCCSEAVKKRCSSEMTSISTDMRHLTERMKKLRDCMSLLMVSEVLSITDATFRFSLSMHSSHDRTHTCTFFLRRRLYVLHASVHAYVLCSAISPVSRPVSHSRFSPLPARVQTPGYIPKKPGGFFWVDPPKKTRQ